MHLKHNTALLLLAALLLAVAYGVYATSKPGGGGAAASAARGLPSDRSVAVDQSSLITVEQLLRLPTTGDERPFAQDALRLADKEMDLAFAQAVREAATRPRVNTPEVQAIDAKLKQAQRALASDQATVASLTASVGRSGGSDAQAVSDRLNLAKAQGALDQDEVDDARQDLIRAGGDPQSSVQAMIEEHEAASRSSDSLRITVTTPAELHGLIHTIAAWRALSGKELLLKQAKASADSSSRAFAQRHDRLVARAGARLGDTVAARLSHDSATALVAATQRRALIEQARTTLDQRVEDQRQLSAVYAGWIGVIGGQERAMLNRVLRGIAGILVIVLIAVLVARWMERLLDRATMDRRRTDTLGMVTRVTLQVVGVLLVLLVVFGPPNNLGTFLGLAGAGLTVALKDFIVAFIGWFVLMGKHGIRIGDLVEINGVTGEVVELGMFYTVLLETGSWTESGHPTGRRVTFTNGFAIEGHYFNFSTSGQWLWDDVKIVVPTGHDPYPIVEAIQKQVEEATADSAREAEVQWREARRSPRSTTLTAAPSVTLKPILGGMEIDVRYITHISERSDLRAKLYHTAVEMLGPSGIRELTDSANTTS